jgi:hypothetical protein
MMRVFSVILAACALCALQAETRTVKVTIDGKTKAVEQSVERKAEGARVREVIVSGGKTIESVYEAGGFCVFQKTSTAGSVVSFTVSGGVIDYSSVIGGVEKSGSIETKGYPYFGNFDRACLYLMVEKLETLEFFSVNPDNPEKSAVMVLIRQRKETIGGIPCQRIKLTLSGMVSLFWSATCWTTDEGVFVKYEGTQGPGTPKMVLEYPLRAGDQ